MTDPNAAPAAAPAAGASAPASPPAAAASAPAAASTPLPAARPDWAPAGLPDHLMGADPSDTLSRVFNAFEGYRNEAAKAIPRDASGYAFDPGDTLKPYFPDVAKDPGLQIARDMALKHKIPAAAFQGFLQDTLGAMATGGMLARPIDCAAEMTAMQAMAQAEGKPAANKEQMAAWLGQKEQEVAVWGKQMGLSDKAVATFQALTDSAAGLEVLSALKAAVPQTGPRPGGATAGTGTPMTRADALSLIGDPRLDANSAKYDREFVRAYEAALRS